MTLLGFVLIALAVAAVPVSRARTGDFFPPSTLFVASWASTLGLYLLRLLPYPPLTAATATLLAGAVALFLAGAAVGHRFVAADRSALRTAPFSLTANRWVLLYSALGLAGLLWYVWLVAVILGRQAIDDPFTVRRALGSYQIPSAFLFLEFFCVATPLLAFALWVSGHRLSRLALAGVVVCSVGTWLSTDRTQFFTVVLGGLFMFVFNRGPRLSWGRLVLTLAVAAILLASNFLIVGALMGKTPTNLGVQLKVPSHTGDAAQRSRTHTGRAGTGDDTDWDDGWVSDAVMSRVNSLLAKGSTLYLYASGSYGALNTLVKEPGPRTNGVFSIYPVARLLERLHVIRGPVPNYILDNSPLNLEGERDILFNGYTFLVYPLFDFGVVGAIVYAGIVGLLSGAAYAWARRRRDAPLALLVMAHLSIALALSVFVNKFNNTASWYIAIMSVLPLLGGLLRHEQQSRAS